MTHLFRKFFAILFGIVLSTSFLYSADTTWDSTWVYVGLGTTLPNDAVNKIVVNSKGEVIFANSAIGLGEISGGVTVFDGKDWKYFSTSNAYYTDTTDFPSNDVKTLCLDGKDNIYASFGKAQVAKNRIAFFNGNKWIPVDVDGYDSLINCFRPMVISKEGILWTGFERDFFRTYNIGYYDGKWNIINLDTINPNHEQVTDLFFDSKDNLWMGISRVGLFKLEKDGRWTTYDSTNGIFSHYISKITEDLQHNIWVASSTGLFKFDGLEWKWINKSNSGLIDDIIYTIQFDNKNNAWLGTGDSGLIKYDGIKFKKYYNDFWKVYCSGQEVSQVTIDSSGNIWTIVGGSSGAWMLESKYVETSVKEQSPINIVNLNPNPATDYIELIPLLEKSGSGGVLHPIKIYNIFGECVLTVETQNFVSLQKIDISFLPAGVYFVKVNGNLSKFIKI